MLKLSSEIVQDLQLLNLPKYASAVDLKRQYHKYAKIYHPDMASGDLMKTVNEKKFQQISDANARLEEWMSLRDEALVDKMTREDGE